MGQGDYEEATSLFNRAAAGAKQALSADSTLPTSMRTEPSPWALRETSAGACSGAGQAILGQKQWEAAEEPLSEVLHQLYQATNDGHHHRRPLASSRHRGAAMGPASCGVDALSFAGMSARAPLPRHGHVWLLGHIPCR